jgi:hypothetical protein
MLPFMNFLPYFTGLNRLLIKYLRITGNSTEIYNLFVLKKSVKTSVNVDNIGPWLQSHLSFCKVQLGKCKQFYSHFTTQCDFLQFNIISDLFQLLTSFLKIIEILLLFKC